MARTMKRHDTADPITGTAMAGGSAVDLSVYSTVEFHAKTTVGEAELIIGGTVTEANADGSWVYAQGTADVAQEGIYDCELECVTPGGLKIHFPSAEADNPKLTIDPDLDDN